MTKGFHAVILGCSSGVGAEIARMCARQGLGIIGFHRDNHPEEASALHDELREYGVPVRFFVGNVGIDYASVATAADEVARAIGTKESVSVLVHSLTGASIGSALKSAPHKVERSFSLLAHSFLWWTQQLNSMNMFDRDGRVIALSNPCPEFYLRNTGVIGAAKAALEAYVRILAVELKGSPTVNCVKFSTVITPALQKVMPQSIAGLEELHQQIVPAGRIQTSRDVADVIEALISPQMRWINGAVLDATGGPTSMLMDYAFKTAMR